MVACIAGVSSEDDIADSRAVAGDEVDEDEKTLGMLDEIDSTTLDNTVVEAELDASIFLYNVSAIRRLHLLYQGGIYKRSRSP